MKHFATTKGGAAVESNADAVYVIGQGGNRTMVRSSTRQAERDFHWCLTLCIAIKRRANWLTAKLSAKLLVSAIVRGEAYELRVGCQEATDVPGVFGQGRASGEGEPDPRSSLPLPFGRPHRTTGAHHGARPASEGGSGADHQTAGGAGHVFSHGSGGSTSGTPRSLYPDPRPAAVAPTRATILVFSESKRARSPRASFASFLVTVSIGVGGFVVHTQAAFGALNLRCVARLPLGSALAPAWVTLLLGPDPVANLGWVLEVLPRVSRGPGDQRFAPGDQGGRDAVLPLARGALKRLCGQVVAAHAVEDHHVEGRRGGALLFEAAYVEAVDVDVAVHDLVERALVAVEGEDYRLVGGEELNKARLVHAVRVELAREERHEVHHVDDTHLEFRRVLAQPLGRSHGF